MILAIGMFALGAADETVDKVPPRLSRPSSVDYTLATDTLHGSGNAVTGRYVHAIAEQWIKPAPHANPAMLDMFRDRDRKPSRQMEPWAGEFAGKYLTSAVQMLRLLGDDFRPHLWSFAKELTSLQASDGYFGPWPKESRLTGRAPNASGGSTWDAWGHYHVMAGLLLWYDETKDQEALYAARKIGDLFCERFLGDKTPRLVDTGSTEMNLAPAHSLCLLYRATRNPKYLQLARQIVDVEFAAKDKSGKALAGDYLNEGLAGKEFFQGPKPRWESLHPIMAMAELYHHTGDERYRKAFEQLWWSICKLDRHNNGGFSSGEQAQGNPYHQGAIETCCTIAWLAMSVEMLKMTGSSIVADELELTTLNSGLGMWSPTGRWATYNTPMDGVRKASAHEIVFQAREGSPELNCCSVNAPRGIGMLSDWAVMVDDDGYVLNFYAPMTIGANTLLLPPLSFKIETEYPTTGDVTLHIDSGQTVESTLKLRIPHWSAQTKVSVNGKAVSGVTAGTYLPIRRRWAPGDRVEIHFDLTPHFWVGERECAGKVSVYRGPILLTWDRRFSDTDSIDWITLRAQDFPGKRGFWNGPRAPMLQFEIPSSNGTTVRLCDFASAGQGGSPYRSWLPVKGATATPFSRANPLRSSPARVGGAK